MSLRDRTEQAENKAKFGETGHFGKKGGRSVWLWGYREGEASSVQLLVLCVKWWVLSTRGSLFYQSRMV